MLWEGVCFGRDYAGGGSMLREGVCCGREYAAYRCMLPEESDH